MLNDVIIFFGRIRFDYSSNKQIWYRLNVTRVQFAIVGYLINYKSAEKFLTNNSILYIL